MINRLEPHAFSAVREMLELCGKNELGLQPMHFSPEKRIELAQKAYTLGLKHFNERTISLSNLAAAITNLKEAEWYLETIEPKPDFYADVIALTREAENELDIQYENRRFNADRAIKMEDWENAKRELQIICESIPNRSDQRNEKARKDLLYIETRLNLRTK